MFNGFLEVSRKETEGEGKKIPTNGAKAPGRPRG